jgi:hypothetical protein
VMRTVGLVVGTGRGGIRPPASAVGADAADADGAGAALGSADGVMVHPASSSARGPDLSQPAGASDATRREARAARPGAANEVPRMVAGFWT